MVEVRGGCHIRETSSANQQTEWMIPQSWAVEGVTGCDDFSAKSNDIIEAAECALRLALTNDAFIDHTGIPLIAHQTSRSADPETWSSTVHRCVERWLAAARGWNGSPHTEMAWFMWDDDGVDALVQKFESDFYPAFSALPYPVEKADAFRIMVLKWFGGVVSRCVVRICWRVTDCQ